MLNIEKLSLQNGFTGTEPELQKGRAKLDFGGTILKGNYHLEQTPAGVVAGIGIHGFVESAATGIEDINLQLIATDVIEKIAITASDTSVQTKCKYLDNASIEIVDAGGTGASKGSSQTNLANGVIALTGVTSAGTLTIKYAGAFAVGTPSDPNVNHPANLDEGEVHINALCRVTDVEGAKPNNTSWTVCPMEAIHL